MHLPVHCYERQGWRRRRQRQHGQESGDLAPEVGLGGGVRGGALGVGPGGWRQATGNGEGKWEAVDESG